MTIASNILEVKTRSRVNYIKFGDIAYCVADSNYTFIKLCSKKSILISKSIKYVEEHLPQGQFLRIHAKYLVNKSYIQCMYPLSKKVELIDKTLLQISRRRTKYFIEAMKIAS